MVLSEMRESRKMGRKQVGEHDDAMIPLYTRRVQRISSRSEGDTHLDGQRHTCISGGGKCVV